MWLYHVMLLIPTSQKMVWSSVVGIPTRNPYHTVIFYIPHGNLEYCVEKRRNVLIWVTGLSLRTKSLPPPNVSITQRFHCDVILLLSITLTCSVVVDATPVGPVGSSMFNSKLNWRQKHTPPQIRCHTNSNYTLTTHPASSAASCIRLSTWSWGQRTNHDIT